MNSTYASSVQLPDGRAFPLDRPRIMGILNVTPDSFSDGGEHNTLEAAVAHALTMFDEGADLIDIGGESTRPGSQRVLPEDQIARTVPVIRSLLQQLPGAIISIDTTRAAVAEVALDAGAMIVNDVSAGTDDPAMLALIARRGVPAVLMHMQGQPATMQQEPHYDDVVAEVLGHLLRQARAAMQAGAERSRIILDPGIGFGKTKLHNLALLAALDEFVATGHPILLGTSRKRFMGSICTYHNRTPLPAELVSATCATTALGVMAGVKLFRVHDVLANRQAADVAWAIAQARDGSDLLKPL
ncbi:MAG: dihydropteroate synthase [Phycisphaeraceae bacterium]|nr:dihydropteroate synthase [Phycisphaeraceae bacterium]